MSRFTGVAAVAALLLTSLLVTPPPAVGQPTDAGRLVLDVPYLTQTEALCGGAAAAMLLRYWGDAHASVRQFEPLVDYVAGGIADTVLIDALRERRWSVDRLTGSVATLRAELDAKRPPMLLIEDRPQRYHYVVAVGLDADGVIVHDPTWGPARHMAWRILEKQWTPTALWMVRITPTSNTLAPPPSTPSAAASNVATRATACDQRLDAALDDLLAHGLERADVLLMAVAEVCPADGRPLAELAGVRFSQRQFSDAARLAEEALRREAGLRYAADVLGSSHFMLNDSVGALRAWNRTGRPVLDSLHITGLTRTRYALLAQALDLPSEAMLTPDHFTLARRRLESMPDLASSRLALRPGQDGYAVAEAAVVERGTLPKTPVQWAAAAAQAALDREVSAHLPGRTGQGEAWSARWGWWEHRPRATVTFSAPMLRRPRGVWQVGLDWQRQSYGSPDGPLLDETRLSGDVRLRAWLTPQLNVEMTTGLDAWTRHDGRTFRSMHVSGTLEHRFLTDHLTTRVAAGRWVPIGAPAFATIDTNVTARSSRETRPLVVVARAGMSMASTAAPLALWSGAGEGRSRAPLLRAHSLLHDGRIDGPAFGRTLAHGTVEVQHWLPRPSLVRIGGAVFTDAAAAGHRPAFALPGHALLVDGGVGLRVRVPGRSGAFRIDYVRGLRDAARAWTVGWTSE